MIHLRTLSELFSFFLLSVSLLLPIVIASAVSFFPFRFDSLTLWATAPNITETRANAQPLLSDWMIILCDLFPSTFSVVT